MGEFKLLDTINEAALKEIGGIIGSRIPVNATVMVGVTDFDDDSPEGLTVPYCEVIRNNGSPASAETLSRLEKYINEAAQVVMVNACEPYDVLECPVLSLGIENDTQAYGVVFVAIDIDDKTFYFAKEQDQTLFGDIEEKLDSLLIDGDADLSECPEIFWAYGVLANSAQVYNE